MSLLEDVFTLEGLDTDINRTLAALKEMERLGGGAVMGEIMMDAGKILSDEQKRILGGKYPELCDLITLRTVKTHKGWQVRAGYTTETIKEHFEVLIIEFGRPGSSRNAAKGGIDKLGRKVGVVQPYSHIRAGQFLKHKQLKEYVAKRFFEEIQKIWVNDS